MSAAREKDQADFDLETFVDLFDTAMSSDNPAVRRALKNLLMIAAIVGAEDTEAGMRQGPLRRMLEDQRNILRRLERVESDKNYPQPGMYGPAPLGPNMPTPWVGHPTHPSPTTGTQWPPLTGTYPPGTIFGTTTSVSGYSVPNSGAKSSVAGQAHMDIASLDGFLDKLENK